jgi:predicted transcriptional regulator YdeE
VNTEVVERDEIQVMGILTMDDLDAIRAAWQRLEEIVPLRGRKFFAAVDTSAGDYFACVQLRDGDDPRPLGLEVRTLPGGRYLRARLRGEPPELYDQIGPAFEALVEQAEPDANRPSLEFYRRRDEVDVLVPVA